MHASKNRLKIAYFHKKVSSPSRVFAPRPPTRGFASGPHWRHDSKTPVLAAHFK